MPRPDRDPDDDPRPKPKPTLPQCSDPNATQRHFRVGSLNVYNPGGTGREGGLALLMSMSDVVLLQELNTDEEFNRIDDLAPQAGHSYHARVGELGISSKYPISHLQGHTSLYTPDPSFPGRWEVERLCFCHAVIHVEGIQVHIFNNHWPAQPSGRQGITNAAEKATKVLATVPTTDRVIFGGDLNCPPSWYEISLLHLSGLKDCFSARPGSVHCTSEETITRIDYMFYRGQGIEMGPTYSAHNCDRAVTDHPFVLVDMVVCD